MGHMFVGSAYASTIHYTFPHIAILVNHPYFHCIHILDFNCLNSSLLFLVQLIGFNQPQIYSTYSS